MSDTITEAHRLGYAQGKAAGDAFGTGIKEHVQRLEAERHALRAALEYYASDVGNGDIARILAAIEPAPVSVREAARVLLDALNEESKLDDAIHTAMQEETDADGTDEWVFVLRAGLRAIAEGKDDE